MGMFEQGEHEPQLIGHAAATSSVLATPSETSGAAPGATGAEPADETVFSVIAGHARTRAPAHLWITAGIGVIDAAALMFARPSLWWASAAFAAVSAYAIWGLADRALSRRAGDPGRRRASLALEGVRVIAVVGGVAAAIMAALGLLGAALGNSGPPG
jgi:hypothetical protein